MRVREPSEQKGKVGTETKKGHSWQSTAWEERARSAIGAELPKKYVTCVDKISLYEGGEFGKAF